MFRNIIKAIAGDPNKKEIQKHAEAVADINALEPQFRALSDDELKAKTAEFKQRLADETQGIEDDTERREVEQDTLADLLPEAFATVREAAMRAIGQRHYDVQLIGGKVLHEGKIAEMRTGEGKTLVATLPTYLNALTGRGVHVITVNDYLARRDARWMAPIYHMLGLTVGVLQEAARTENGKKAFVVDFARESNQEDQNHIRLVDRSEAYAADIVYGTNHEFGFDYLRDNMAYTLDGRVQRERYFAIVDEVDNILIDEARTPLIISGPAQDDPKLYYDIAKVVRQLRPEDFEISERDNNIALTEIGEAHLEKMLGQPLRDPDNPEELTPEQARLLGHIEQAMRAEFLFKRNKDYLVEGGKVVIVDEFTGRKMIGRRWSDGLHQAVEAKEALQVQAESVTYATITLQNYFRLYAKLGGMSGTALTEAEEFDKIYKLGVVAIPTNLEYQATRTGSDFIEVEYKEDGQKFYYFTHKADAAKKPVLWRRKDYPDMVYRTEEAKLRAISVELLRRHLLGQPILIGTTSVELSERVSERMRPDPLQRLAQVLLIRSAWFEQNKREEDGMQVKELDWLEVKLDDLNRQELAKGLKDLGLSSNPYGDENIVRLAKALGLPEAARAGLVKVLQAGIRHNVLNAKKHDEESQIIADAGALGAVTIATNMAGRGVDIKLGGELAEEALAAVNRILRKAGIDDPYDLSNEQRKQALLKVPESEWSIYEAECRLFLQMIDDAAKVKEIGGLHVVGSERHEARRIDNQLRGRAARQGDPGSSQFYLSLEDELMRRFGGENVSNLMRTLRIDDSVPIAAGIVNKTIEQSQTRVEGANFDTRKHLLEYDDVLNSQRNRIYGLRDRIFEKDDLTDDFAEMLSGEVGRRVDAALADTEGRWKLLAWLEETQPSLPLSNEEFYPSYLLKLLLESLEDERDPSISLKARLLQIAREALEAEREHLLDAIEEQVEKAEERLEAQIKERKAAAELALEELENQAEETGKPVEARPAYKAIGEVLGITNLQPPLEVIRDFNLGQFKKKDLPTLAEAAESARLRAGLIVAIERRVGGSLGIKAEFRPDDQWDDIRAQLIAAAEKTHTAKAEKTLTEIERELKDFPTNPTPGKLLLTLVSMAYGTATGFDQKTHRKISFRTLRLTYFYSAAELISEWSAAELKADLLKHLQGAFEALNRVWGEAEFRRLANTDPAAPTQAELGKQALTPILRQLMHAVIGQLWVEYLTSVEALRTSIGLEAYGQRDPLVAYKGRASEMFATLLTDIRGGVVSRAFTVRPRVEQPAPARGAATPARGGKPGGPPSNGGGAGSEQAPAGADSGGGKKRRRRR